MALKWFSAWSRAMSMKRWKFSKGNDFASLRFSQSIWVMAGLTLTSFSGFTIAADSTWIRPIWYWSEHIAKLVRDRSQVPANRVRVIPYAADPDRFRPQPSTSPNSDNGACRFLFAGGITQRKGLSDLLKAWAIVRRPGWSLSLVGAAPKAAESLVPKDDPSINLLGKVAYGDMPKVMAEHDLFLFPSLFEGSAVVCYEALASGLPVITTPQAGSVVRDGMEGRICEAADHKSLSAAMMELGTDPELRARMSESARLRALDHTWDHYRERVMQALEEVADMSFREIGPLPRQGPK